MIKVSTLENPVKVYRSYCKYYWESKMIVIHTYDINGEQICDLQGPYSLELHKKVLSNCDVFSFMDGFPVISEDTPESFVPHFPSTYKEWVEAFGEIEPAKISYAKSKRINL
jgi:hypothetical protein